MSNALSKLDIDKTLVVFGLVCNIVFLPVSVQSAERLLWDANSEPDLAGYIVYQGATAGSYGSAIDVGNVTSYTLTDLDPGMTYYLAVTAYDLSGNESLPSDEVSTYIEPVSDEMPPTVSLNSPISGTTLTGVVEVEAVATDDTGVAGVQFQMNGTNWGAENTTVPYSRAWDTTIATPGTYTLTAVARDAAGNTSTSVPVTVHIAAATSILTVSVVGNGTVVSDPSGILCTTGTCSASYETGSTISLRPEAGRKWNFSGWTGACSGTGDCAVQLSSNQAVGATFSKKTGRGGKGRGKNK